MPDGINETWLMSLALVEGSGVVLDFTTEGKRLHVRYKACCARVCA